MVALCSHFSDDVRAYVGKPLPFPHCFFVTFCQVCSSGRRAPRRKLRAAQVKTQRESCFKKSHLTRCFRPLVEAGVVPPLMVMLSAPKLFSQKNATLALGSLAQVEVHARTLHNLALSTPCRTSGMSFILQRDRCAGPPKPDQDRSVGMP